MVVPELLGDLGLAIETWGALWAAIAFGVLVFSIPGGALGDRFGARRAVGCGIALIGGSLLLRAGATGFPSALLSMVLFGLALGAHPRQSRQGAGALVPARPARYGQRGESQAGIGLGLGTAMLVTPMILTPLGGWRGVTRALGWLLVGRAGFWLLTVRDRVAVSGSSAGRPRFTESVRRVLAVRDVRLVALCNGLYFGGYLAHRVHVPGRMASSAPMIQRSRAIVDESGEAREHSGLP